MLLPIILRLGLHNPMRKIVKIIPIFLVALVVVLTIRNGEPDINNIVPIELDDRLELSLEIAEIKLKNTLDYLQKKGKIGQYYPVYTENKRFNSRSQTSYGEWIVAKPKSWAVGMFPAILWQMNALATDPQKKAFWREEAEKWSETLRKIAENRKTQDVTLNNLLVFRPWYDLTEGVDRERQLQTILEGATWLAEPFKADLNRGKWHQNIGVMGWQLQAKRTDHKIHWQAFIDHSINVEQLLWAAEHNKNGKQAREWRNIAQKHFKTIAKSLGKGRKPGTSGSWQRGYFDDDRHSSTYGQFLFNEGKQGWKDDSTWSRGQAWAIYTASVTYQYTKDSEILTLVKEAIDYFLANLPDRFPDDLRRPKQYIPPWDFDYAKQIDPDTEVDSSAATIAIAGMLKLIKSLPENDIDRTKYLQQVTNILYELTSPTYLSLSERSQMSIILHGCYHHNKAIEPSPESDNGLIWGDYFFLDAVREYKLLKVNS